MCLVGETPRSWTPPITAGHARGRLFLLLFRTAELLRTSRTDRVGKVSDGRQSVPLQEVLRHPVCRLLPNQPFRGATKTHG